MTVNDLYRALWRHRYLMVFLTACAVLAAWVVSRSEVPVYQASTLARVQQQVRNPGDAFSALQTGGRLAQTYAEIVTTSTIRNLIQTQLGDVPARDIRLEAAQVQDLDLLTISARSTDPNVARRVADAAPKALTAFIARTGTIHDSITTIAPAATPTSPVSPRTRFDMAIAAVLGLILAGCVALLVEIVADRIRGGAELERITGLPILVTVPTIPFGQRQERERAHRAPSPVRKPDAVRDRGGST